MSNFYHNLRQICNGTRTVNNAIKYRVLAAGLGGIHLLFAIIFFNADMLPLCFYNVAIVIFYVIHIFVTIPREKFLLVFATAVTEIFLYSVSFSLLLGWNWGFSMYMLPIVSAAFYLTYTLPGLKNRISLPVGISVFMCCAYIVVRAICGRTEPFYKEIKIDNMQISFYYFNIFLAFAMLVLFSALFALEIRYMQRRLEMENLLLSEAANYDPLTKLFNRRYMNEHMRKVVEEAEKQGKPFCIILADIDDFKQVNDTYGHDCGDEVLVTIANTIYLNVREEDIVCRWGGEEILILIRADLDIATRVGERICQEVREEVIDYAEEKVRVTLTMGVAEYKKSQSIRFMIEEADRNLYYGKAHGKNQLVTSYDRVDEFMG